MAIKKSELYSSLWSSCDELRGGMDASQYKDYVLALLFIKYVSDRFAGRPFAQITVPAGASFADMVVLKGKTDIGDQINKKIVGPLWQANQLSDPPDFNDPGKLGSGKEMVDKLTGLIAIFQNPDLDFSKNRAEGDDLLGDAYEYLMAALRHREWQEQGAILHTCGSKPNDRSGSRDPWRRRYKRPHLLERKHNRRFIALMYQYLPKWMSSREVLNSLPFRNENWSY
jgi:type I restriction-modification system DNA methylase subunit